MMRYFLGGTPAICLVLVLLSSEQTESISITHGPILGRPTATSTAIWARTSRPGTFRVRYGIDPKELKQTSKPVTTTLGHDCTGWINLEGLKSDTVYHYRVVTDTTTGPGGSFRTLPDAVDYREAKYNPKGLFNFRFEIGCCSNQREGQGNGPENPTYKTMLNRLHGNTHFAIQNGDWLYEDCRDYTVKDWLKQVRTFTKDQPKLLTYTPTIVGVWENYKKYLRQSPNLSAWHRNMPSYFTFDDHEILNDIWGAAEAGLRDRRAVFRDIGVQAWFDYLGWANPTPFTQPAHFGRGRFKAGSDVLIDPDADFPQLKRKEMINLHVHWGTPDAGVNDNKLDGVGGDPNAGVYDLVEILGKDRVRIRPPAKKDGTQSYSIGRKAYYRFKVSNCEFFCLDTRSHRQMHDVKNPTKPGLSMIGKDQKEWLLDGMKKSTADFFFIVSSVNFMIPHVGGGAIRDGGKDEAWTVFLDEREQLIKFFETLKKPVFVMTGDLHNSFAVKITDHIWEFGCGPHNSENHIVADEGDRPANGMFKSGPRKCDIRWSSYYLSDIPRVNLLNTFYVVVQVNNIFANPRKPGDKRWIAYPRPQIIFSFYDGKTGELRYAETVQAIR